MNNLRYPSMLTIELSAVSVPQYRWDAQHATSTGIWRVRRPSATSAMTGQPSSWSASPLRDRTFLLAVHLFTVSVIASTFWLFHRTPIPFHVRLTFQTRHV